MKVLAVFALLLLSLPSRSAGKTIRQIELRGNARIYSSDVPVRRGRLYLFHRYPDGLYMSVAAEDVLGIAATQSDERPKTGNTVVLGPTGEGRPRETARSRQESAAASESYDQAYPGYYGYCYGCYVPPAPPPGPVPPPPALVGPNGFPLPPGSPPPLPIGPNGFPILAPSPPPARR
jgi:hypothetical protein